MSDVLGFKVNKDTKKEDVGNHFKILGKKLGDTSKELEEVAVKAEIGVDKGISSKSPIREAVDSAKEILSALKGYLDSLKDIGDSDKVGEVGSDAQKGVSASINELKVACNAFKGIVNIAEKVGVDKLAKSDLVLSQASIGVTNPQNGAKILAKGVAAGEAVGDKAVAIVSAVSGKEILSSIVGSSEDKAVEITSNVTAETTPLEFAVGGATVAHLANAAAKASAVSGGIALRSLVKGGKLATHNGNNDEKAVQSAGITAVNKLLGAVEGIVKKTVKNVLEKVKQEVDNAREPKALGKQ